MRLRQYCRPRVTAGLKIGMVTGDDIMPRLDEMLDRGIAFTNMDTGEPLSSIRSRVQSANVYFGAFPIADALCRGAGIVITGRCNDAALALWGRWYASSAGKPMIGTALPRDDCRARDRMRRAVHRRQLPGGLGIRFPTLPTLVIRSLKPEPDGTFVVTKHAGTGGRVNVAGVTEQLLYEIGDPKNYITPDGIADFTTIRLEQQGPDRVRLPASRAARRPINTKFPSAIPRASRRWARWLIRGPMRTRKRERRTRFCGSAWNAWG